MGSFKGENGLEHGFDELGRIFTVYFLDFFLPNV
jgi:hypothetical protein